MQVNKEYLYKLAQELSVNEDIQLIDIPDIDLYMDQVTTFIDKKMSPLKREPNDKILTKTMINNYTKEGLIFPPKNKKYSRQHMILLILVYNLKQILSIKDITTLLKPLLADISGPEGDKMLLDQLYCAFLELKKDNFDLSNGSLNQKLDLIKTQSSKMDHNKQETAQMFLTVLLLINQANAQKRLAEKIIDEYF